MPDIQNLSKHSGKNKPETDKQTVLLPSPVFSAGIFPVFPILSLV